MNTKKENNISISSIIIIVILLGCAGGAIALGFSLMKRSEGNRVKVDQLRMELASTMLKVKQLPELRVKHKSFVEIIQRLKEFIPTEEGQADFVLILEGLAKRSNVTIKNCKLSKEPQLYKGFPQYRVFQWEIDIDGNYQNIKSFLELLQNINRLVMVSNLKMNAYSDGSESGKVYSLNTNLKLDLITKLDSGR